MLVLLFNIQNERYAIETKRVIEIIPSVPLRQLIMTPPYVAGLLNFRSHNIPVIDISILAGGKPSSEILSTRIVVIEFDVFGELKLLGLKLERATETIKIEEKFLKESEISIYGASYLGKIFEYENSIVQLIAADLLLQDDVKKILYHQGEIDE